MTARDLKLVRPQRGDSVISVCGMGVPAVCGLKAWNAQTVCAVSRANNGSKKWNLILEPSGTLYFNRFFLPVCPRRIYYRLHSETTASRLGGLQDLWFQSEVWWDSQSVQNSRPSCPKGFQREVFLNLTLGPLLPCNQACL